MKHLVITAGLFFVIVVSTRAQEELNFGSKLKLKDKNESVTTYFNNSSKSGLPPFIAVGMILVVINPELVIENRKVYFGLTKELSVGKYPYGRFAFEYTYVFRDYSRNHFRISYNQDYIFKDTKGFILPVLSAGLGYFTDTEHKGYFGQASAGIILPFPIGIVEGIYAYLKGRHTFVQGSGNSNITDFSLGMSLMLYY